MKLSRKAMTFLKSAYIAVLKNALKACLVATTVTTVATVAHAGIFSITDEKIQGYIPENSNVDGPHWNVEEGEETWATIIGSNTEATDVIVQLGTQGKPFKFVTEDSSRADIFSISALDIDNATGNSFNLGASSITVKSGSNIDGSQGQNSSTGADKAALVVSYLETVEKQGVGNYNININNAKLLVEEGASLNNFGIIGANYNVYAEEGKSSLSYYSKGSISGYVEVNGSLTETHGVYGVLAPNEDGLSLSKDNFINTTGSVTVGKSASVTGLNKAISGNGIFGVINNLQGNATGSVDILGTVKNLEIVGAYLDGVEGHTSDITLDGSVNIAGSVSFDDMIFYESGSYGPQSEEGAENSSSNGGSNEDLNYEITISAATGINVDNVKANAIITGSVNIAQDMKDDISIQVTDIEGKFKSIDSTLTINQSKENNTASQLNSNPFGITNVHIGHQGVSAESSKDSTIVANTTIAGYTGVDKSYTLNNVYVSKDSTVEYAGKISSDITVKDNAQLDTINGINLANGATFSGSIDQTITVQDKAQVTNINLLGNATASEVKSRRLTVVISGEAQVKSINLSSGTSGASFYTLSRESKSDNKGFDLTAEGNVTLGSIQDAKVNNLTLDAQNSDSKKAVLTYGSGTNDAMNLEGSSVTVLKGGKTGDVSLIAGSVKVKDTTITEKSQFASKTWEIGGESVTTLSDLGSNDKGITAKDASGKIQALDKVAEVTSYSESVSSSSKTLSETVLGTAALVNQAQDFVANVGLDAAYQSAKTSAGNWSAFGALNGGYVRYETGSHVDLTSVNGIVGMAKNFNLGSANLTTALFMDLGTGSSDVEVDASSNADGDHDYIGGGLAARLALDNGLYFDASFRAGQASTEFEGRYAGLDKVTYDTDSTYIGAHAGLGFVFDINNEMSLDTYARYTFTRLDDDTQTLNDADNSKFEAGDVTTHGIRLGSKFNMSFNNVLDGYVGLAYQRIEDGEVQSKINSVNLEVPTLEGNTGILDLGLSITPENSDLHINLGLTGYAGDQRGVTGSVLFNYGF